MKTILAAFLSFLLTVTSFFGITDETLNQKIRELSNGNQNVSVIVELEEKSLLDGVNGAKERKKLLESYLGSEKYEKIVSARDNVKKLVKKSISGADFSGSYSYSFVINGFSLSVPYKYIDDLENLPGVKNVSIAERYSRPESVETGKVSSVEGNFKHNLFTGVPEAQSAGYTGKGTVIAILDTGFQCDHEAFSGSVENAVLSKKDINVITTFRVLNTIVPRWGVNYYSEKIPYKWDYAEIDKTVDNDNSDHGTHVAGIIGANAGEITGVAPDAQFLFMKVFGDEENSSAKEEVNLAALDDAVKLGADVVNMSLGSPSGQNHDNPINAAVFNKLERSGITVSASAGNEASMGENDNVSGDERMNIDLFDYGTVGSPASYKWPVAVASSDIDYRVSYSAETVSRKGAGTATISDFSSWGVTADLRLKPEITAPGSSIYSCVPGDSYRYMSGTSMSAPYYTGCYALVKQYVNEKYPSKNSRNSAEFINSLLMSTAVPFRGYGEPAYYSPRRQGAGLVAVKNAVSTPAYLTQSDGTSRPKIDLGENTSGVLEFSFVAHNLSKDALTYKVKEAVLTDSYVKQGSQYVNTLKSKKLYSSQYSVEYTKGVENGVTTLAPGESKTIQVKITVSQDLIDSYREVFTNGFFVDGFIFLNSTDENIPSLSLPFVSFNGDWSKAMLFDNTIYDSEKPYMNGEWGLAVTDGEDYYPLGANIFERGKEYGIDAKYCAFSKHALESKMKKPYVTANIGLIRNGKRMDYNLFTKSGVFRFCGSSLLEYARKTNAPYYSSQIGVLWGQTDLIDGNSYVYKVSTSPANYKGGRKTISMPFVVDNQKPVLEQAEYRVENGEAVLTVRIKDNRYVMGFEMFDNNDRSLGKVSFKGVEPDSDGVYTHTVNVSKTSRRALSSLGEVKLYIVDYAYNEAYGSASLSGGTSNQAAIAENALTAPRVYSLKSAQTVIDTTSR